MRGLEVGIRVVLDHRLAVLGPRIAPIHHGRRLARPFPYGDEYVGWVERSDTHRRDAGTLQLMGIACGSTHPTRLPPTPGRDLAAWELNLGGSGPDGADFHARDGRQLVRRAKTWVI